MEINEITIGTRGSILALVQAKKVKKMLLFIRYRKVEKTEGENL